MRQDTWIDRRWRPAMGWTYMLICILDFAVFPVLWSIIQAVYDGNITSQWNPITLQGAGLFHMAMGAILGVAAWSRGREKVAAMQYTEYQPTSRSGFNGSSYSDFQQPRPRPAPQPEL